MRLHEKETAPNRRAVSFDNTLQIQFEVVAFDAVSLLVGVDVSPEVEVLFVAVSALDGALEAISTDATVSPFIVT